MRKRSIERITYYDPPEKVYNNLMTSIGWEYRYNRESYRLRDQALQVILYIATCRITELVGGLCTQTVKDPSYLLDPSDPEDPADPKWRIEIDLPPVTKDQFVDQDNALWLRDLPIIKQKFVKRGGQWVQIIRASDYPSRVEIPFFKDESEGSHFPLFTEIVTDYLETIPQGSPVFDMSDRRARQIINEYGLFPHYYRDMGLKMWRRYFKNNSFKLKRFSGHKRWASLEKYQREELFS